MGQIFIHKKAVFTKILQAFLLLLLWQDAHAQIPSATLERGQIVLGDQIRLTFKIENMPNGAYSLNKWFNISSSTHIEVVKAGKIDTVTVGENTSYTQDVTVTSFDSGRWSLPIVNPLLQDKQTGREAILKTDSIYLAVLPVDVKDLKDYHDIKDIEQVKYFDPKNIYLITGAVVVLILLFLLVRWIVRRRRNKKPAASIPEGYTPLQWALAELEKLRGSQEPAKKYFTELDHIMRQYLDNKLQLGTLKKTSDEIMVATKLYMQDEKVQTAFFQQLRLIDAVKFAKYTPSGTARPEAVDIARHTLEYIDKQADLTLKNTKNAH